MQARTRPKAGGHSSRSAPRSSSAAEPETSMFKTDLLAGKKILVTGGGTGLGKSIGRRYLELGAHLVICGRRKEVLDATADEFRATQPGARVDTLACDVRDADQVEAMMAAIWE